ncbi:MAG: efflux RND transporter periplasmic adaptor subunit [Gemmatimonadetes bacterium]|nr:efflux RND transporter periplasmic adaptor subunit [Gemmatimonadota bacterium]
MRSRSVAARCGLVLAALPLLVAVGCGDAKKPERTRPPVAVLVALVRRADVPYTIEANGVVTPQQSAAITAQVDGIVQRVSFREGQEVTKGQELFAIDARPYQAAYDQVRAALARDKASYDVAKEQLDRYQSLAKTEVVTREQVDQFRATAASTLALVQLDSAQLATARFNLDNTIIRAPISGRTGSVLVLPGNQVRAGAATPLLVIHQTHPIFVRFAVPATELRNVLRYGGKGGLPVLATPTGAGPNAPDTSNRRPRQGDSTAQRQQVPTAKPVSSDASRGSLSFVDNAVDTTTGTVMLKATFANTDGMLWVGQFVSASLQLYVEKDAITVPAQAVVTGQRGTYVYVLDDSLKDSLKVRQRPVVVERTAGAVAIIASGLAEGERVVTDGQSRLTPGAPVEIKTGLEAPGGGRRGKGGKGGKGGGDSASAGGSKGAPADSSGGGGGRRGGGGRPSPTP